MLPQVLAILLAVGSAFAASTQNTAVEGYVLSFDHEAIVLESGSSDVRVPRKFYRRQTKVGEKLSISMSEDELGSVLKTAKPSKLRQVKK